MRSIEAREVRDTQIWPSESSMISFLRSSITLKRRGLQSSLLRILDTVIRLNS